MFLPWEINELQDMASSVLQPAVPTNQPSLQLEHATELCSKPEISNTIPSSVLLETPTKWKKRTRGFSGEKTSGSKGGEALPRPEGRNQPHHGLTAQPLP